MPNINCFAYTARLHITSQHNRNFSLLNSRGVSSLISKNSLMAVKQSLYVIKLHVD